MAVLLDNTVQKALTTLARAKSFLGISGDSKDTVLTILINQVTGAMENYCGRHFLTQTYTAEEYDGVEGGTIVLKNFPVTAFTKLEFNGSGDSTDDWEDVDSSTYTFYTDGRVVRPAGYVCGPQRYRATYTAGYKIDFNNENDITKHTLPQEIEYACMKMLSAMMNTRQSEGLASAKVGDISMSFRGEVMKDAEVKEILGKYASITI